MAFVYPNNLSIFLVFILAFLVSRSRVRGGVHSTFEAFMGAILGIVVTVLVFQILKN